MRHLHGHKKISRPTDQRLALLKGLAKSLIRHGEITTSQAKAKALARYMQKLVKWARKGDVASLREIRRRIDDRDIIRKLTSEILPKLSDEPGGEVSVFSAGQRRGDGAPLAVVTFNLTE
jgi:large subunit ribosomal protein L17